MSRKRTTSLILIAAASLAACGDDGGETVAGKPAVTATATVAAAADGTRYCALVTELDAAGEEHFSSLGRDAGPEEYEAAERSFIEDNAARLDELQGAAPAEISEDVRVLVAAQRGRAGLDTQAPTQKQASAAERRIKRFEKANC